MRKRILKTADGSEFMHKYHKLGSLASRDIVARAIDAELKKSGATHVYLDARHLGEKLIKSTFQISKVCLDGGIDIVNEMIPVVPAAIIGCGSCC